MHTQITLVCRTIENKTGIYNYFKEQIRLFKQERERETNVQIIPKATR